MTMRGARIAALRRQAGMSQAELARLLGVSPSAVGMYEQGRPGGRPSDEEELKPLCDDFIMR